MGQNLAALHPRLLAMGLLALRQNAVLPRLVNTSYNAQAGERGSVVEVPIPSAVVASSVTPAATAPAGTDLIPTVAQIAMNQWDEAAFTMSDKEQREIIGGVMPMVASEAIKALGNKVDVFISNLFKGFYSTSGSAGTTPFASDLLAYKDARKLLNVELAPMGDRRVVLDPNAEANAMMLDLFLKADQRGDQGGVIEGNIGRKLGADWYMDQNIQTHTSTPLSAGAATANGVNAVGATTISVAKATNTSPLVAGDRLRIAGDPWTYVVTQGVTLAVGNTNVSIQPPLRKATIGGENITLLASHVLNGLFHRDAIGFATRPLEGTVDPRLGVIIGSAVDPVTGLTLRLEINRQYKRTRYAYDILYGGAIVRRELGAVIMG